MSAIHRLENYLDALRRRLRLQVLTTTAACIGWVALLGAVLSVAWLLSVGFAQNALIASRVVIALAVLVLLVFVWWRPLKQLKQAHGAREFERRLPDEQGRIATFIDARRNPEQASPLVEMLALDAERIAATHPMESIVPAWRIIAQFSAAVLALFGLLALLFLAPGQWSFGARHLLLNAELPRHVLPIRRIALMPGDATVRRNSDLLVRATIEGFEPDRATLHVQFADQPDWERAPMQAARASANAFELKLFALRSPFAYYVEADGTRSATHKVTLADLPRIEEMRLTYRYPEWTGLPTTTDVDSRDIRAVAGTEVSVEIISDGALESPVLVHDDQEIALQSHDGRNAGTLRVNAAGQYHVAARVAGETVALSDDYTIEIIPDEKPTISIDKPGRDWRATSIEEVPVQVQAADDFRLQNVELRYAVNGGEWRSMPLKRNVKQARERTLLELEKLGAEVSKDGATLLTPGDLVSYYAVAKDHKRSVQTDLYMVQVQPFERRFLQQNNGGGGGMGDEQGAISERQREILLATWNLQRSEDTNRRDREQLEDNAKMLSDMQATLAQQARTLAARTRARTQIEEDERVKTFVESLEAAALVMDPAAIHLAAFELDKAVAPEQQALQQLLRAEAAFRDVQVSMQNEGGGQGSQSARDFSEMFELEMDVQKSQYESEQQVSQENTQRELDEAARKLKELAQRQEQLAEEAKRNQTMTAEQRWRQEQLRREAEDLRQRLAQMQRSQANQQASQPSQSPSQSGEGGSSQGNAQRDAQADAQRAIDSMDRALEEMQAANRNRESAGDPSDAAQQASEALQRASQQLQSKSGSNLSAQLNDFAERARNLEREQQQIESDLLSALSEAGETGPRRAQPGQIDEQKAQSLVEAKQAMAETLSELQMDLRNSAHEHRGTSNPAKQQLTEIVNDVESSDLMYRVRRSAAEIYYGRARDAAAREGLITEGIQALEQNLRDAAARAGEDQSQPRDQLTSESLLAEVADLRRRLEQRERLAAANGRSQERGNQERGDPGRDGEESSSSQTPQGNAESDSGQGEQGNRQRAANANSGQRALSAWDPNLANARLPNAEQAPRDSLARQAEGLADRAARITERTSNRDLSANELAALRQLAREVRQLAGDPTASRSASVKRAVSQLELAALAARTNSLRSESARTTVPVAQTQEYREAVAEYYRRLGGS